METTQSTAIADYFVRIAGIPSPWRATKYNIDDIAKMVHIWITRHPLPQVEKKRSWFGVSTTQTVSTVADYSGAIINVSLKSVDHAQDKVDFYGPVFPHVRYKLAQPFIGSYETAFVQATADLPENAGFSCNCILNFLYSELEGNRTGHVTGPMTFGEVAYVLLNQTMVHLALEAHS